MIFWLKLLVSMLTNATTLLPRQLFLVGARGREHPTPPAARRHQRRARIVLEEPAGEVATGPRGGGCDAYRSPRPFAVLQGSAQKNRNAVVGDQRPARGALVCGDREVGAPGPGGED